MAATSKSKTLYKVAFSNGDKVYELYARSVSQGLLFGFVEIADLVFGESSTVLVDPGEEKLRTEFADVQRLHIPMHAVIRIDEVTEKYRSEHHAKITEASGGATNVTPFPVYTPKPTN